MTDQERLLLWNIPANLRWLAENPTAARVPCGHLTGHFLNCVATHIESTAKAIEAQRADTPKSGSVEDESAVPERDLPNG